MVKLFGVRSVRKYRAVDAELESSLIRRRWTTKRRIASEDSKVESGTSSNYTSTTIGSGKRCPEWIGNPVRDGRFLREKVMTIKDFQITAFLKRGDSSVVELSKYKLNDKYYALKKIPKSWIYDTRRHDHVVREMKIHLGLSNKFVANLFRAFDHHTFFCFVVEYCPGADLLRLLKRHGTFPLDVVRFYAAEIVNALRYLHETQNVIYRHLEAANVMLSSNGHVKLVDFGNAVRVSPHNPTILTTENDLFGKIDYLAPELIPPSLASAFNYELDKVFHSYEVDYWALGVLIYQMLSMRMPFGTEMKSSPSDICKAIMLGKRKALPIGTIISLKLKRASAAVLDLLDGLLCVETKDRWKLPEIQNCELFRDFDFENVHKCKAPFVPPRRFLQGDVSAFGKPNHSSKHWRTLSTQDEFAYCFFEKEVNRAMHEVAIQDPSSRTRRKLVVPQDSSTRWRSRGDISELGQDLDPENIARTATRDLEMKKRELMLKRKTTRKRNA